MILNIFNFIAEANTSIWGSEQIDPGIGTTDFSKVLNLGINLMLVICSIAVVAWGLWGALDWITAGGNKEQLEKAQAKIRNAFLGLMVLVLVIIVWAFISGSLLGIVQVNDGKAIWKIPTLRDSGPKGNCYCAQFTCSRPGYTSVGECPARPGTQWVNCCP